MLPSNFGEEVCAVAGVAELGARSSVRADVEVAAVGQLDYPCREREVPDAVLP